MAATQQAVALTNNYRAQQAQLTESTVGIVTALWGGVNPDDIAGTYPVFLTPAIRALSVAQQVSGGLAAGYLPAFIQASTGRPTPRPEVDPATRAGLTTDGRPIGQALQRGLLQVKLALSTGRPVPQAMDTGLAFAVRTTRTEVPQAGRDLLGEGMLHYHEVKGWVRVTSARPCGACLARAGEFEPAGVAIDVHAACQCTAEPAIEEVPDRYPRMTGQEIFDAMSATEQDALFAGRGGADKADLIRNGDVPLSALVTVQDSYNSGRWITETPLAALTT
ncbi:MAG: hypothetical protein M3O28_04205 [Actinomycetota bacterium]|nr:hypothetical protein [Actinomycetota bacterium]